MRLSLSCAAAAALVGGSLFIGGCGAKQQFPSFPAAAPLGDIQAAKLAGDYLQGQQVPPALCTSIEATEDGHLVEYVTVFDGAATPPRASHLVLVKNTGAVRELAIAEGH